MFNNFFYSTNRSTPATGPDNVRILDKIHSSLTPPSDFLHRVFRRPLTLVDIETWLPSEIFVCLLLDILIRHRYSSHQLDMEPCMLFKILL